jgi:hypothetical protein
MNQEATPDDVPVMFSFRPWNSRGESWDDYIRALERAYAQYLDRCRQDIDVNKPAQHPDREEEIH